VIFHIKQTKRLNIKFNEHRNRIKRNSTLTFVMTNNCLDSDHEFDLENIKVLDEEINYKKRFISKMIHIKN